MLEYTGRIGCSALTDLVLKCFSDTVQLGYCDSDVSAYLLFLNMPIIQNRDVKYLHKQYRIYLQAF